MNYEARTNATSTKYFPTSEAGHGALLMQFSQLSAATTKKQKKKKKRKKEKRDSQCLINYRKKTW